MSVRDQLQVENRIVELGYRFVKGSLTLANACTKLYLSYYKLILNLFMEVAKF